MPYSSNDYTMSPNGHTLVKYAKAELSLCRLLSLLSKIDISSSNLWVIFKASIIGIKGITVLIKLRGIRKLILIVRFL